MSWLLWLVHKAVAAIFSTLVVKGLGFVVTALRRCFGKFARNLIRVARKHEYLCVYADLEEVMGDFLETYRDASKQKPSLRRLGFYAMLVRDSFGLCWALISIAIMYLFESDNTRA